MESPTEDLLEVLRWDSDHFGFPVARVRNPVGPEQIRAAARAADDKGIHCLTALFATDQVAAIGAAEGSGFRCYDVRIELGRQIGEGSKSLDAYGVRLAAEDDLPSLEPVARTRFSGSRFSVDPHFPDELVEKLYVEWLWRGFKTEERILITAAELNGFVICHLDRESYMGTVELIAVAATSEREGLGSRLVLGAETAFRDAGLKSARVVTQGSNLPAQRLYQRHGYRACSVKLWLHRWAPTQ